MWSCFFPCLLLGGAAWSPPSLGEVLLFFLFLLVVLPSFSSCRCGCVLLGGAAWSLPSLDGVAVFHHLFGGLAFLRLLWVGLLFPLSSVGWCCLVSSPTLRTKGRQHHAKGEEKSNTTQRRRRPSSITQQKRGRPPLHPKEAKEGNTTKR